VVALETLAQHNAMRSGDGHFRAVATAALTFAVVASSPRSAAAYRTAADLPGTAAERVRWESNPRITIGRSVLEVADLEPVADAVTASMTAWNQIACAYVSLQSDGLGDEAVLRDDRNTITLLRSWPADLDPAAAATTEVRYLRRGDEQLIVEADIYLNGEHHEWSLTGADSGATDLRAVLTHEFGHLLGLLHPCGDPGAPVCDDRHEGRAMHPTYSLGQRTLSDDERDGLCFLYPVEEPTACPMTCPSGLICGAEGYCTEPPCNEDADCASSRCTDGRCLAVAPDLGDPCAADQDCGRGLCASDGRCRAECPMGDCGTADVCEDGWCQPASGGSYGDPCTSGADCASGWCWQHGARSSCTRPCDGACPAGDDCALIDDRAVCAPPISGGCSAGPPIRGSGANALVAWLLLMLGYRRGFGEATKR